jgi:hypothetical protein
LASVLAAPLGKARTAPASDEEMKSIITLETSIS